MQNNEFQFTPWTIYKNQPKMDHRHKCKTKSIKLPKENVGENPCGSGQANISQT